VWLDTQGFANGDGMAHATLRAVGGYYRDLPKFQGYLSKRFDAACRDAVVVADEDAWLPAHSCFHIAVGKDRKCRMDFRLRQMATLGMRVSLCLHSMLF
jgi:hypothetical protein